jgi:hypothetical protein
VTEQRDDKAFEDYLDGRSPLSDSYARLKGVGPSEDLDQRVLAEARRAADQHRTRAKRWWRPWPALATIAVAGIAALLTLDLLGPGAPTRNAMESTSGRLPVASPPSISPNGPARRAAGEPSTHEDRAGAALKSAAGDRTADEAPVSSLSPVQAETLDPPPGTPAALTGVRREEFADRPSRSETRGLAPDAGRSSAVAAVSQYSAADESGTLPGSDLPADLAAGDPEERARIAEALALATERMRLRRPPSPTRTRTSVPDSRETPAAVPASRADMAEQTSSTVTLEDDPELWLEFIDVLTETGMRGHAAEMTRRYRDAFPGRPLDPRHEALLEE